MCMKNFCSKKDFYNEFHDIIIQLQWNNVQISLFKNKHDKQCQIILRIFLKFDAKLFLYILICKQLSLRICFIMIINKSQNQFFMKIVVDLRIPMFIHSQLYVTISRVMDDKEMHVLLSKHVFCSDNVVYLKILQSIQWLIRVKIKLKTHEIFQLITKI